MQAKTERLCPAREQWIRHLPTSYSVRRDENNVETSYYNRVFMPLYKEFQLHPNDLELRAQIQEVALEISSKHTLTITDDIHTPLADGARELGMQIGGVYNAQAEKALAEGRDMLPDVLVTSTLTRTQQSLEFFLEGCPLLQDRITSGTTIVLPPDPRVREMKVGEIVNYLDKRIFFALNPDEMVKHMSFGKARKILYAPPGGENVLDVLKRLRDWENDMHQNYPGKKILIFSHNRTIIAYRLLQEGFTGEEKMSTPEMENLIQRYDELSDLQTPRPGEMTTFVCEIPKDGRRGRMKPIIINEQLA